MEAGIFMLCLALLKVSFVTVTLDSLVFISCKEYKLCQQFLLFGTKIFVVEQG